MTGDTYVELTRNHIRPESVGNDWTSCEISLVTFEGDWYDAADIYRNWAGPQFGVTKIADRTDIPGWLQSGNGGLVSDGNFGSKNTGDLLTFTVPMYNFVVLQE